MPSNKVKATLSFDRQTWYDFRAECQRRGVHGGASAVLELAITAILHAWDPGRRRRLGQPLFPAEFPTSLNDQEAWDRWKQQLREGAALENAIPAAIAAIAHELRPTQD